MHEAPDRLPVLDPRGRGAGQTGWGTYQNPILIQWRAPGRATRTLDITVVRFGWLGARSGRRTGRACRGTVPDRSVMVLDLETDQFASALTPVDGGVGSLGCRSWRRGRTGPPIPGCCRGDQAMLSAAVAQPPLLRRLRPVLRGTRAVPRGVPCLRPVQLQPSRIGHRESPPDLRPATPRRPGPRHAAGAGLARRVHSSARWCPPPRAASSRPSWSALAPTIG